MSKFGRCRFALFLMVESVHQIPQRLSKFFDKLIIFTWIAFTASEISFSEKKTFNLIWEKIRLIGNSLIIFTCLTNESSLLTLFPTVTTYCWLPFYCSSTYNTGFTTNFWKWILAFLLRWQTCNYGHRDSSSWRHKPIPAFKPVDLSTVP